MTPSDIEETRRDLRIMENRISAIKDRISRRQLCTGCGVGLEEESRTTAGEVALAERLSEVEQQATELERERDSWRRTAELLEQEKQGLAALQEKTEKRIANLRAWCQLVKGNLEEMQKDPTRACAYYKGHLSSMLASYPEEE